MGLEANLAMLRARHGTLDEEIRREEGRRAPDEVRLGRLKREKLRLKDEIGRRARSAES